MKRRRAGWTRPRNARARAALLLVLLLAACSQHADDGPVIVAAIGGAPEAVDPRTEVSTRQRG